MNRVIVFASPLFGEVVKVLMIICEVTISICPCCKCNNNSGFINQSGKTGVLKGAYVKSRRHVLFWRI